MNFFDLVNFGTPLSPEELYLLAEPLPPDSVGTAGIDAAGVTAELTACLLEGEGGLGRRKAVKNKFKTSEKRQSVLTYHCYQWRRTSTSGSLPT